MEQTFQNLLREFSEGIRNNEKKPIGQGGSDRSLIYALAVRHFGWGQSQRLIETEFLQKHCLAVGPCQNNTQGAETD